MNNDRADTWPITAENVRLLREILARNLRQQREQAGMTREALERATGITTTSIKRHERAKVEPSLRCLVAFSFALGVPLDTLLADVPGRSVPDG